MAKLKRDHFTFCDDCNKFKNKDCGLRSEIRHCSSYDNRIPDNDSAALGEYFRSFLYALGALGYSAFWCTFSFPLICARKAKMFTSIRSTIHKYHYKHNCYRDVLQMEERTADEEKSLINHFKIQNDGQEKE